MSSIMSMNIHLLEVNILLNTVTSPFQVAVYTLDGMQKEYYEGEGKASEELLFFVNTLVKRYCVKGLFFIRGPGSSMGIKMGYLAIMTLHHILECDVKGCDAFVFSHENYVRATRKSLFHKENDGTISLVHDIHKEGKISLPLELDVSLFSEDISPLYVLPAV